MKYLVGYNQAWAEFGEAMVDRLACDEIDPIAPETIKLAWDTLEMLCMFGVPDPGIEPCADSTILVQWHDFGMDIELIFYPGGRIYTLIEDSQKLVSRCSGFLVDFGTIVNAFVEFVRRANAVNNVVRS